MFGFQVFHKCHLVPELWRGDAVIDVTVPPLRMDPIRPLDRVSPLHMLFPIFVTGEVQKGLDAILGYADVRLDILVNMSPRDILVRVYQVKNEGQYVLLPNMPLRW